MTPGRGGAATRNAAPAPVVPPGIAGPPRRARGRDRRQWRLLCGAAAVAVLLLSTGEAAAQDRWLGRDKALHFAAGAALSIGGYALGSLVFEGRGGRIATGLAIGIGAGAAKELRDRHTGGTPSWRDLTWTAGGAATGVTAAWLVDRRHASRPADLHPAAGPPPSSVPILIFR